jgi:hypothetical protein
MAHSGLQEAQGQVDLHILLMESNGLHQLLEMLYLQGTVIQLHGMALSGLLVVVEQINLPILQMESNGSLQPLEILY